ncbi:MAG TPA: hypothetical protein PKU94_05010 [Candidatus Hydrothermia bacterium]|nr:hypothetical protein [Candidatus Hydrothermae bacterium]MDD3649507.1 hypothetical protein [Candidatus Hydrothermia bacterium]MDD5572301.1 hypothetical protein [Candidatus Hydrothermia bacterium]HOK23444.1 hypothetical protein [Candidatus Hydrothermia bacterium]HOL23960.1 hypothetical protein [Candidatus Hydrothermia bacterium]
MGNDVEVFSKLRKKAPPELDVKVKRAVRRVKIRRYVIIGSSAFVFALCFGALINFLVHTPEGVGIMGITMAEEPNHEIYPGVLPIKAHIDPPGIYSYKVYLNGDVYVEGYTENEIDDSVLLTDPINNIDFYVEDLIEGFQENLSWVVYNF